jgi:hypothetical protein
VVDFIFGDAGTDTAEMDPEDVDESLEIIVP